MNLTLHNTPFTEAEKEQPNCLFSDLQDADRFNNSVVLKRTGDSITVKRHDDWLVTSVKGDWVWDKMVVKK